jgi:AMP nucleosidase
MAFYRKTQRHHVDIALGALDMVRRDWPLGMPNSALRSPDEPLMGEMED